MKKNSKRYIIDFLMITLGSLAIAVGTNVFLLPSKLSTGGISGVGIILYHLFSVPLSVTVLVLNAVLFIFGYKLLRRSSLFKTALGIALLSVFLELTSFLPSYGEDTLICAVFGGIMVGLGVGLTVVRDASTGGSDFAALMLKRLLPHVPIATFILVIDSVVLVSSGIVFRDYTIMFYSVISLYIASKVTDLVIVRGAHAKSVYIVSSHAEEIANSIMHELDRGVTGIYSQGLYKKDDRMMLLCVMRNKELPRLLDLVKSIDADAFTIISDVHEVRGMGFSTSKEK